MDLHPIFVLKNMESTFNSASNAIIIDASFLNFITSDFKSNFEKMLHRELPAIDLSALFTYIALDWGIQPGDNDIDVYLTYGNSADALLVCAPSSLKELDGLAFKSELGEFRFRAFSTEGLISPDVLFLDSLANIIEEKRINRLAVIGFNEHYGDEIKEILEKSEGKLITNFAMQNSDNAKFITQIIAYPIMMALGIKSDELQ